MISGVAVGVFAAVAGAAALQYDVASLLSQPQTQQRFAAVESSQRPTPARVQTSAAETPETKFDVVRIDPEGASVFAGRAPANAQVTIMANSKPIATTTADRSGDWSVVTEKPFAAGDYQLSLTAKPQGPAVQAPGQSVRITIASEPRAVASSGRMTAPSRIASAQLPLPITFTYDQSAFTPQGERAAAALSQFLLQQKPTSITLTGHADERGSDPYNMDLSQQRLDAVARYLRAQGFAGKLVLVPKGKSEPYAGLDRRYLTAEQGYQLDRRVEFKPVQ